MTTLSSAKMWIAATALLGSVHAMASDPVTLTFNRTGATASDVTVSISGAPGATAVLKSVSTDMKTSGAAISAAVLCPNVNGNTSPTITFDFTVTGLPADFKFNTVGLDIHALNGAGNYQEHSDGAPRRWNVDVAAGSGSYSLTDIDIAAGVNPGGDRHQVWDATGATVTATSPMDITITVTKGSENLGCFFGLGALTLSESGDEPEPPLPPEPPVTGEGKTYVIKWKNNTTSHMCEANDGGIVIDSYSTDKKIFWELIPTDNEDCYYIRNCASGRYIGSCNLNPSSASKIKMSATPVEYYIHLSASTSGENKGCWWMSSTDCANYSAETSGARCLNKDGASSSIITWTTGLNNYGSYWTLTESPNLFEVRPFKAADQIGSPVTFYQILHQAEGKALTHGMEWKAPDQNDAAQKWYFVGKSNAEGGYKIVEASTHKALNDADFSVCENKAGGYSFIDQTGDTLSLASAKAFRFKVLASDFARSLGLHSLPCGSTGDYWVTHLTSDNFEYPLPTLSGKKINHPDASKPTNKYTIITRQSLPMPMAGGSHTLSVKLNKEPGANLQMALYLDLDNDGIFEKTIAITPAKEMNVALTIDEEAALNWKGNGRARLRLTTNGLMDADDEVVGQIIDMNLSGTGEIDCRCLPGVAVNDPLRGTAVADEETDSVKATPLGTSAFVCWLENGLRYFSTEQQFKTERFSVAPIPTYTAVFSPNLDDITGLTPAMLANKALGVEITFFGADKTVKAVSANPVRHILVFATDGTLAAMESGSESIALGSLPSGVYIVKAVTDSGTATLKIAL